MLINNIEQYSKLNKTYFGKDAIDKIFNDMINESDYCYKIIEREFNKLLVMTKKNHKDFINLLNVGFVKCEEGDVKVNDHFHIDEKHFAHKDSAHKECNLNLRLTKKIPVVFHSFQNYDSHLTFQKVGKYKFKINIIPKTIKIYMSFTIKQSKKNFVNAGLPFR